MINDMTRHEILSLHITWQVFAGAKVLLLNSRTRWYDSCTDLIKLSGIATKTNSSSGLLTPETSPCHENEVSSRTFRLTTSMFDELTSEFGQRSSQMVQKSDFDFFATSELRSLGYSRCLIHNREYTTFMIMFFMNDLEWKMNNEIILCLNDSSPNAATVIPTGWNQAIWLVHSSILWIQVFAPEIFSNLAVE